MDAELKIVGAIVIVLLFLANTGIGIWIYRIMKSSERVVELDKIVLKNGEDILLVEKQLGVEKQVLSDKLTAEREQRIKYEARVTQVEKDSNSLVSKQNEMYDKFIETTQKFQSIATELNTTMKHINGHIEGIQLDIRDIRGQVGK